MNSYRAELLRSSNRATLALLMLCLALGTFSMINAGPQHQTPLWGFQQAAIFLATLLMGRAATVAANDFSNGTIRAWLISTPARTPTFLGKLTASITVALGVCAVAGSAAYVAGWVLGHPPALTALAVATGQLAVAATALTIFGHAVGVLTRSVPVALTATLAWILPAEAVLAGRSPQLDRWLPGITLHEITLGHLAAGTTPASALTHATIPFLVLDAVALILFLRRDITS